jgi:hypothetical protein
MTRIAAYARIMMLTFIIGVILGGCQQKTSTVNPSELLTLHEEAEIYIAIFAYIGSDRIDAIDSETSQGLWRRNTTLNCESLQTSLMRDMPTILTEIIPAFCDRNRTIRPVNPEIIKLLSLEIEDWETPGSHHMIKVSSIQVDTQKLQALVFVEIQDGDVFRGTYLLLVHDHDLWRVLYDKQVYIS